MADRETLDVDVLIVGGGPAGMSAALRLAQLQKEKGGEPLAIAVLRESARARRAFPVRRDSRPVRPAPARAGLQGEGRAARLGRPPRPRVFPDAWCEDSISDYPSAASRTTGTTSSPSAGSSSGSGDSSRPKASISSRGLPATELLFDGDRVVGVRTGDRGIDKHRRAKVDVRAGVDVRAKVDALLPTA